MKRTQYTLFSLLMTLFMSQLAYAAPQKHVVIISWDGAKPSVIRSLFRKGHMPHLHALMKEGAYTLDATTIVPSITLPSHTSMLTGVSPRKHGITWNRYKPKRGTPKVPTLFKLAKRHKLSTAMIYTKSKFRHIALPGTLDYDLYVLKLAPTIAKVSTMLMKHATPALLFVHYRDIDNAGHRFGWGNTTTKKPPSSQYIQALKTCDKALGQFVTSLKSSGLWHKTLLIVTADHGGHDHTHGIKLQDQPIPWIAAGGLLKRRGPMIIPIKIYDTAPTALKALGIPIPSWMTGKAIPLFSKK